MRVYKSIRSEAQRNRCQAGGTALYCKCGCMSPHDTDPTINIDGVDVLSRLDDDYADYIVSRRGIDCGSINTQYRSLLLDGVQYLGVDRAILQPLIDQALALPAEGDTITETVAATHRTDAIALTKQDTDNLGRPGYCNRCHTYCYGDCNG